MHVPEITLPRQASLDEATRMLLALVRHRLGVDVAVFSRIVDQEWTVLDVDGGEKLPFERSMRVPLGATFCSRMLDSGGALLAGDVTREPLLAGLPDNGLGIESYVGVALRLADGEVFGTLCGFDREVRPDLTPDDLEFLRLVAVILVFQLDQERTRLEQQRNRAEQDEVTQELSRIAYRDHLTGLLNRRGWEHQIAKLGPDAQGSIVSIDMNGLKTTNDTLGHAAGDEMLVRLALSILGVVREGDLAARFGGDEFVVLFRGLTLGSASQRLRRIVRSAASAQPPVSFCAGVAATSASMDASQALVAADRQLVARKRRRFGSEALSA